MEALSLLLRVITLVVTSAGIVAVIVVAYGLVASCRAWTTRSSIASESYAKRKRLIDAGFRPYTERALVRRVSLR
jgi:hypothetical protein